jgi:hypothetical protein
MVCCGARKSPRKEGYNAQMDYTDYLWIKFTVLVGLAAVYGFWRGINGKSLERELPDKSKAEDNPPKH